MMWSWWMVVTPSETRVIGASAVPERTMVRSTSARSTPAKHSVSPGAAAVIAERACSRLSIVYEHGGPAEATPAVIKPATTCAAPSSPADRTGSVHATFLIAPQTRGLPSPTWRHIGPEGAENPPIWLHVGEGVGGDCGDGVRGGRCGGDIHRCGGARGGFTAAGGEGADHAG